MRREYSHKTSSCHGNYPRENKLNPRRALWHNQYRHRAPGSVKFRTGGHSPRTAPAGRQKIIRIFASAQDAKTPLEKPARKRGRTGENPVPTVQSGWKVARAEKGRSALRRTSRETGITCRVHQSSYLRKLLLEKLLLESAAVFCETAFYETAFCKTEDRHLS